MTITTVEQQRHKNGCFGFDTKTGGYFMGYSTLIFRAIIAILQIHTAVYDSLSGYFEFIRRNYRLRDKTKFFMFNNTLMDYGIYIPLLVYALLGVLSSIALIYGIKKLRVKFVYFYLAIDLLECILLTILSIASFTAFPKAYPNVSIPVLIYCGM